MASLTDDLQPLLHAFTQQLDAAQTEQAVRKVYADFGGANGAIRGKQKELLKAAPNAEKKAIGQATNEVLQKVDAAFEAALKRLGNAAAAKDLERTVDVTLPGRGRRLGHLHPITLARREIEAIFAQIGFTVAVGPQVETDFHNFEALAMPKDHPARDMQDTFYVEGSPDVVLRTHTSPVQIRTMLAQKPPVRVIIPGTVYRRDDDATHSPMFHQIECFLVDRNVTMAHLRGVLAEFAERFFGAGTPIRLRPSYFPFVEPGAEVDVGCPFCKRADGTRAGCSVCKRTGWIEILGCGMIHPVVFESCGIDPEQWTGFAFGMGLERVAVVRYGIPDMRVLFENDPRFLSQF
jgi:phenylalanyl-tRNA synthetase alpha chain